MIETDRSHFIQWVRDALTNLYDPAHIETHPLLNVLVDRHTPSETRGVRLREMLIAAIEHLKPDGAIPFGRPEWLGYRIMQQRYIEAQHQSEVCQDLGLSHTTFYRYHREAMDALGNILWERFVSVGDNESDSTSETSRAKDSLPCQAREEVASMARSLHRQWINLREVLAGVSQTLSGFAKQEGIAIWIETPPELQPVYMDPAVLRQIWLNLLAEASAFSASGALRLIVGAQDGALVWQLRGLNDHAQCKRDLLGSVGFVVSQSLAQECGGDLWLESDERNRAVIHCSIPNSRPKSILIIDDNRDTVRLYQRYLQERDYAVAAAGDADAVRRLLSEARPDLILLDVLMPDEDGWNILQSLQIAPNTADIPVVICSVLSQPRLALTLGARAVLQKPVDQETLVQTIEKYLHCPDNRATTHRVGPANKQSL